MCFLQKHLRLLFSVVAQDVIVFAATWQIGGGNNIKQVTSSITLCLKMKYQKGYVLASAY